MESIRESKLFNLIKKDTLRTSIELAIEFVKEIWDSDRLLTNFTDHTIKHNFKVLEIIEKMPNICKVNYLDEKEIYVLIMGIFLHDIGMQCDIRIRSNVKEEAERIFNVKFSQTYSNNKGTQLTIKQQKEIRDNHSLITAAWISILYYEKFHIPERMVEDIIDVCKYHSKLNIEDCPRNFKNHTRCRKKLIATILRLGDELDISYDRDRIGKVKESSIPEKSKIYWYIYYITDVEIDSNSIKIQYRINPEECKENIDYIERIFQNKKLDTPHNKRLCGYFDFQNIAIQMNK